MSDTLSWIADQQKKSAESPKETWSPTMRLRINGATLQQLWKSNHGNKSWRAVPKVDIDEEV